MRRIGLVVAAVALAATGCSADAQEPFRRSLEWGDCPSDVEVTFLSRHECGYLTVLEDRSEPAGRTIRMLVAKVWPVGIEPLPGIGTGFGGNVGDPRALSGGIATGATRLGHVVVQMESRGAGPHAEPSLACPEVDELDHRGASSLTGDSALIEDFLAAVRACRDRVTASGVDVADYDTAEGAADIEDLRVALDLQAWAEVGAEGTSSRFVFEHLRRFPDRVERAFLDSPWFPEIDDLTGSIAGMRSALEAFFTSCGYDAECNEAYPLLEESWRDALLRLSTSPLQAPASAEQPAVVVDAGRLLRAARFALGGDGPGNLEHLPGIIVDAAAGKISPELARIVADDPLFCAGYRPLCAGQDGFSWGVYLTAFCRDQLPFVDPESVAAAAGGDAVTQRRRGTTCRRGLPSARVSRRRGSQWRTQERPSGPWLSPRAGGHGTWRR